MQPPRKYQAKLEDKQQLNQTYVKYSFELLEPHRMEFLAGQYLSVKVSDDGLRRSYSICSSPDIKHGFELLIEHIPNGVGSQFFSGLQYGQQIEVLGPMGQFVMADDEREQKVMLIATGSGIAPMNSMILNQLQVHHDERPITLLWGMRHETELFWELEYQQFTEDMSNFEFIPTISKPVANWPLFTGRVTDYLREHKPSDQTGYYLCGGAGMIEEVKQILNESGISQEFIHHEKFF